MAMGRRNRQSVGGVVYHALNRANAGMPLFESDGDYKAFGRAVIEAVERVPMRILGYCLMPNHWHFVLWPHADGDLSRFMQWLGTAHVHRWQAAHGFTGRGHLYQGRFKDFAVESDQHYLTVHRYVERNGLRAGLVSRAEDWPWGSLHQRFCYAPGRKPEWAPLLADGPVPFLSPGLTSSTQTRTRQTLLPCGIASSAVAPTETPPGPKTSPANST